VREADNLTTFMCRMSWESGSLNLLEPFGPHRPCYGAPLPVMGPIDYPETSETTSLRCVTSQKSADLIYTPAEA